ncbi:MAG: serine/threonine protein kinase [Terracidiphilus sp.]
MNTAEGFTQLEGRVVNGRFRLLRWLGGSRVSDVFLTAIEGDTSRMAVLKLVAATAPDAEVRLASWIAAARLSHPNLISIIDCGRCEIDGCQFVYEVMEYADEVLAEILPARPLSPDETREMLRPVLNALEYMQAHGYVHGRIKPSNILVVNDRLKLSGDCIALAAGNSAARAETGAYDAPELGRGTVSPAVDVWALGMTLVAALTQKPAPWERWIQEEPVIPAGIAEPFGQIAQACLRVDPAKRCTLDRLRAILDPGSVPPVAAIRPEKTKPREETKRASRWKANLIAVAAVVVVAWAALMVRKAEFPAKGTRGGEQQTPASASVATPAPKTATEKPSPSGRGRQAAPETKVGAGPVSVLPGVGSNGVLRRVIPDVPPAAQQSIRGQVVVGVRVTVDAAGNVTDAVLESPSRSTYFNRVAVDAARQWKFAAERAGGTPGGRSWTIQFEFRQDGIDAGATAE